MCAVIWGSGKRHVAFSTSSLLVTCGLCGCRWPEQQKRAVLMLRRSDSQLSPCCALSERVAWSAEVKNYNTETHRNKTC